MSEAADRQRAINELRALEEHDRNERRKGALTPAHDSAIVDLFTEARYSCKALQDATIVAISIETEHEDGSKADTFRVSGTTIERVAAPTVPAWQVIVHTDSLGVITDVDIRRHGLRMKTTPREWTDRHTLAEVVAWANRETACDACLTMRHVTVV